MKTKEGKMKTWRPDRWKVPYGEIYKTSDGIESFELGADAMLEALRKIKEERWCLDNHCIPDDPCEKPFHSVRYEDSVVFRHPATKVIESGYFCVGCFKQIRVDSCGVRDWHDCPSIRY